MDQKWIQTLLIVMFYQEMTSGAGANVVNEGDAVDIVCQPPDVGTMISWFRVLDGSGVEFLASFTKDGIKKSTPTALSPNFSDSKVRMHILTLKSFRKARDSGVYGCASIKNSELVFGPLTRLIGVTTVTRAPVVVTAQRNKPTTATACVCKNNNDKGDFSLSALCSPIILGPLAGGCGLCLLLLIITILYCNRIRTRRCPHHYKRKPQMMAPGKQMMTNRHA